MHKGFLMLLYYFFTFITGIIIAIISIFGLFSLNFFSVGASTYQSFSFFCILYGVLGFIFGFTKPAGSWKIGFFLGLPMFILLGPLNFGDPSPLEQIPRLIAALSPFLACISAYLGGRVGLKQKKNN